MNWIKRKLAKFLFSEKERAVIMSSLFNQVNEFKRNGDTDNAVFVQTVATRADEIFDLRNRKYTQAEVDIIVNNAIKSSEENLKKLLNDEATIQYQRGYEKAFEQFKDGICIGIAHHFMGENKKADECPETSKEETKTDSTAPQTTDEAEKSENEEKDDVEKTEGE